MLKMEDLQELENYLRSGELEKDFHDGCENDRQYLLELLEKLMDIGELADEAATRVIYRGLNPGLMPVKGLGDDHA
ncbi:MAG: hypothetical protein HDQ94_00850 [Desulfovibrio sp.]|nr:hypothetical protein [Desulfovibrio sp.]